MVKKVALGFFLIVASIVVVIFLYFFIMLFFFKLFGFCPPGTQLYRGLSEHCYFPSGNEGKLCFKKTDCGIGDCVIQQGESKSGICRDTQTGCVGLLDENSNKKMVCID